MITEVIVICKLLFLNPAPSATGEWSFSMARRVKTVKQQRFNNEVLLHTPKARTDNIRLLDVANEFVQRNENRFRNFGKFTALVCQRAKRQLLGFSLSLMFCYFSSNLVFISLINNKIIH